MRFDCVLFLFGDIPDTINAVVHHIGMILKYSSDLQPKDNQLVPQGEEASSKLQLQCTLK